MLGVADPKGSATFFICGGGEMGAGLLGGADCPVLASTFIKPPASPLSSRERGCIRQQIDGGFREQRLTGQTTEKLSQTVASAAPFLHNMFILCSILNLCTPLFQIVSPADHPPQFRDIAIVRTS